jgi:hypothetical protein
MPNNIINASSSGSGGLITTAADSGSLELQSDGTTIATLSSTGLTMAAGKKVFSEGSVVQVVNATYGTQVTNNTSTYADTGLTATITPKFATSTIFVLVTQHTKKTAGNAGNAVNIKLFRNSTDLGRKVFVQNYTNTSIEAYSMAPFQFLDSPATTSATTYKTQFANDVNTSGVIVQADSLGISTITLMEIAA